jgi:meiotically up-regulated gene 157 (Mug157) protein
LAAIPNGRPPVNARLFISPVVDQLINNYTAKMKDSDLATLFSNCLPNTLDTTVHYDSKEDDTFVVTGK